MFFAVAVAALTGCSKDEEIVTVDPVEAETKTISDIVVGLEPGTRVYMGAGYKVYWDEGDVITVWTDMNNRADFVFKEYLTEDKSQARFQAQNVQDITGSRFYAVYPAITTNPTNLGNDSWRVAMTLGAEQLYRPGVDANTGTYSRGVAPIAAQTTTINDLEQAVFKFHNLCSLIELQLKGNENLVINGISLEATINAATNVGLYGDANITFPSDVNAAPTLAVTSGRTGRNTLSLTSLSSEDNSNGIAMSDVYKPFYFVVPSNVAVTKLKFVVEGYDTTDNSVVSIAKSRSFSTAQYFEAGKLNQIGANFTVAVAQKYKVGDIYDVDGLKGVVFSIDNPDENNAGLHGKIVAMTDTSTGVVWSTLTADDIFMLAVDNYFLSTTDGEGNMKNAIAKNIAEFPAFQVCQNLAPAGAWYLPAQDEWTISGAVNIVLYQNGERISGSYWMSNLNGDFEPVYRTGASGAATGEADLTKTYKVRAIAKF